MRWTWDPNKNAANRLSHGLSFETAALVFDDPLAATREDPYAYEQRWRTMGMVGPLVLMVVHTWPDAPPGSSARKATNREREAYEEGEY